MRLISAKALLGREGVVVDRGGYVFFSNPNGQTYEEILIQVFF